MSLGIPFIDRGTRVKQQPDDANMASDCRKVQGCSAANVWRFRQRSKTLSFARTAMKQAWGQGKWPRHSIVFKNGFSVRLPTARFFLFPFALPHPILPAQFQLTGDGGSQRADPNPAPAFIGIVNQLPDDEGR